MEIETLKDIKEALNKFPDKVLENYGVGIFADVSDTIQFGCWADDPEAQYGQDIEDYKEFELVLSKLSAWLQKCAVHYHEFVENEGQGAWEELDEPISSKTESKLDEVKLRSSSHD